MISEIICVGDELLAGQVTDTNSTFLSKQLSSLGLKCKFKTVVGDNKEHIVEATKTALQRANIIIFTGGLGPTEDDLTVETIAEALKVPMVFREDVADMIRYLFAQRDIIMPESNLKQAYVPQGADILANDSGTAPGIYWELSEHLKTKERKIILAFPGVPREMEYLWEKYALPILMPLSSVKLYEKYINFVGIGESALVESIPEVFKLQDPAVLPYANNFQVQLRVYSEKESVEEAKTVVNNVVDQITEKMCGYVYGYDSDTLESVIGKHLISKGLTVSVAESCTGGLISSRLTDVSGSSQYIKYNAIVYSNDSKVQVLGVPEQLIIDHGAVSSEVAKAMALGVKDKTLTDVGLAITGIAGPTGATLEKPVGTVYIALAIGDQVYVESPKFNLRLTRLAFKYLFSQYALNLLRKYVLLY